MSIYFTSTLNNESNVPISVSFSDRESNYIDENIYKSKPNINDEINPLTSKNDKSIKLKDKINEFYKFKYNKNSLKQSKSRKNLNKIKVYIIVKPELINGRRINVPVPINNYEDLGNTGYSRAFTTLASTFLMRTAQDIAGTGLNEGSYGSRPFILENTVAVDSPYETEEQVSLNDLSEGIYNQVKLIKENKKEISDPDIAIIEGMKKEEKLDTGWDAQVLQSEINLEDESDLEVQILEAAFGYIYYYSSPYEYKYSFLDNTLFTNSRAYPVQPRDAENFNRTFKDLLNNFKNFDLEEQKHDLKLFFTDSERILFKNTTELLSKNIIPIFCELEEAQALLITILDELTDPFRAIRPIETSQSTQKILTNISKSLDYLDDSLSLENHYFSSKNQNLITSFIEILKKYRLIKSPNLSFSSDIYNTDNYQLHGTKMRKSLYENWQLFFDEVEELGIPYDYRKGPWDDTRSYLPKSDKKLLSIAGNVKILSVGLGDFLEFWNNDIIKNGEVLFIPSLEDINRPNFSPFQGKSKDQFYEYQQKFRGSQNYKINHYNYKVQIS